MPIPHREYNPYVEAFWKWWPELYQDLHTFRITGGEPMLWQRETQQLLRQPQFNDLKNLTIETNCTQPFKEGFDKFMHGLVAGDYTKHPVHVTWSTSPKLSISGERWDKAIKPEVAYEYIQIPNTHLYFKFVVESEKDLVEVDRAREEYKKAGIDADIYLMAVGATVEGQTTAFYIQDSLKKLKIKVSKLAQGLPVGGEIENLDDGTLISAFKNRRSFLESKD